MFVFAIRRFKLHVNAIRFLKYLGTLIAGLVSASDEVNDDLKVVATLKC